MSDTKMFNAYSSAGSKKDAQKKALRSRTLKYKL